MNLLLECHNICKSFGGVKALKNVNFSLNTETHAFVGENGAGKSTLIKIITGVLQPNEGEIWYQNKKVNISSPKIAQELGISAVFQEPLIYPELTVLENIFLGNEIKTKIGNVYWKKEKEKVIELFNMLDMSNKLIKKQMFELNIGLQQLVLIAKALVYQSKIIIFDEPTASLTEHEARILFNIIKKLNEKKVGVIYISHRLEEVFSLSHRITVMRDGNIVGEFTTNEITKDKVIELMTGKHLTGIFRHNYDTTINDKPILEVRNLTKKNSYYDISFKLYHEEILCFYGLVGAGRTDIALTIFGLLKSDSGEIFYQDKIIKIISPEKAMKHGIAYLPEDRKIQGLFYDLSVSYNITVAKLKELCKYFNIVDREKEKRISEKYVKELNIKVPTISTKVMNLSGGNQQKVVFARWLLVTPQILILDEPTRGVDVAAKEEIYRIIFDLADKGLSIIVISQELPEVLKLANRVIVLCEGRITGIYEGKNKTSENLVSSAIGENKHLSGTLTI